MKKVYCKNCKYYCDMSWSRGTVHYQPRNPHQCHYKDNVIENDTAINPG